MNRGSLRITLPLIAGCFAIAAIAGCSVPAGGTSTSLDGKTLVAEQCGQCHPIERVNGAKKDQAGWTATVGRMRTNGLSVSDEQAAAIVKYLTERDAAR